MGGFTNQTQSVTPLHQKIVADIAENKQPAMDHHVSRWETWDKL